MEKEQTAQDRRFLGSEQRTSALRDLEREFDITLTEAEVFQAARLFLSLVSSSALINPAAVAQEVRRQRAGVQSTGSKDSA